MEMMYFVSSILKFSALASYVLLVIITIRSKSSPKIRLFFSIYLSGMIFWQFSSLMVNFSTDQQTALLWYNLIFSGSGLFSVLFFPFTRAFLGIGKQRVMAVVSYIACVFVIACGILGVPLTHVVLGKAGYFIPLLNNVYVGIVGVIPMVFLGYGVVNLIRGLLSEKSLSQKNRIKYLLGGSLVMILGAITNATALQDFPIDIICNLVNAALIGYAVIRHRLLDIRIFILRSVTYTLVTGTLIGVYAVLILVVEDVIKTYTGYTSPLINIMLVLGLMFILLPIRNKLQSIIDRMFFRTRYDYQDTIEKFSKDINTLHEIDKVLSHILITIQSTIKIERIFITLFDEEKGDYKCAKSLSFFDPDESYEGQLLTSNLKNYFLQYRTPVVKDEISLNPNMSELVNENQIIFEPQQVVLIVPFILKDQLVGTLHCGKKMAGTVYTDEDLRFLTTIANQSSTAIDNAMIYMEIERRLAIQTLLFILSETFRSSKSFDDIMNSVVKIMCDFLTFSYCCLICFEQDKKISLYAFPELEKETGELLAAKAYPVFAELNGNETDSSYILTGMGEKIVEGTDVDSDNHRFLSTSLYIPLKQNEEIFGLLIIPNKVTGHDIEAIDEELLRTVRAIISQGIMLHRTIINLINMKNYNEKIIDGMNKIGDALIIVDLDGKIRNVNEATCTLLEYEKEELIGADMCSITTGWLDLFNKQRMMILIDQGSVSNYELPYLTKSGTTIPMLFSGSIIYNETGKIEGILGIARDISSRKQAEEAHKKELLLKEIHHRVKNNLQVVSSLLSLQSSYTNDEKVKTVFKESQSRIKSMALIHENLYLSKDLAGIDFNGYVKDLTKDLFFAYNADSNRISLDIDIPAEVSLTMHQAIPCGLIINELVTNSLKYAFPGTRTGKIFIRLVQDNGNEKVNAETGLLTLVVGDDGVGIPIDFDPATARSLGLKLVFTLTKQLDGTLEIERNNGAVFTIRLSK